MAVEKTMVGVVHFVFLVRMSQSSADKSALVIIGTKRIDGEDHNYAVRLM